MSQDALESQGMKLKIDLGNSSPSVYVLVPDVKNLNFRTGSASIIDTTDMQSSAKEKRMGLPDEGQCTFTINFVPQKPAHQELLDAKADRQAREFEVELTDTPATKYRFQAFVMSVPLSGGVDAVIESSVTLEITGAVVEV